MVSIPSYMALHASGALAERAELLKSLLTPCTLCPHVCGNDRLANEIARCHTGLLPVVSSITVHHGEEPGLGGTRGVGNIFFGNCNLHCVYCQNHVISQNHRAERVHEMSIEGLAEAMLGLQEQGVHAIGLVSPTHVVPQIVGALDMAVARGLHLPLIYNTNAYDAVDVLKLLEGIIDIYLPDLKYDDEAIAYQYSGIRSYPAVARAAIKEMHRQVGGPLALDGEGVVRRGLVIRHLVLPNDLAGSRECLTWVRDTLGPDTTMSIMAQYNPMHKALTMPLLDRKIRPGEYARVLQALDRLGMDHGWTQHSGAPEYYCPDFDDREHPFEGISDNAAENAATDQ